LSIRGHAQHGAADFSGALADFGGRHGVFALVEPAGVAVDHRERSAKFVRRHGDEIALHERNPLLLRQLLLEQRGLPRQRALAAHQFDGVVTEDHGCLRHLADLVAALGAANVDVGVAGGEPAHAVGEPA